MDRLLITYPSTYQPERAYAFAVIFRDFWRIEYETRLQDELGATEITMCGDSQGAKLVIHDGLFSAMPEKWLTPDSLPPEPILKWVLPDYLYVPPLVSRSLPVIYGHELDSGTYYRQSGSTGILGLDVFGSVFYCLTRYEEAVKPDRDKHDRFPATASLAFKHGFLDRPIVNEYTEILWRCMTRLWPNLRRKTPQYRLAMSHDVDYPFLTSNGTWDEVLKHCLGDIIKRRSPRLAMARALQRFTLGSMRHSCNPFDTFGFIMDTSEQAGLRSAFYFMADNGEGQMTADYSIDEPWIRALISRMINRGHEVGYHAGYGAFDSVAVARSQLDHLCRVLEDEKAQQNGLGGRMHYLRWKVPDTWQLLDDLGLSYDSTVGFAEQPGFRCGTCYEYRVFNLILKRQLHLVERPLIAMDTSLFDGAYMGLTFHEAREILDKLCSRCKIFGGTFTLLWHNNNLVGEREKSFYSELIAQLCHG